MPKTIHGHQHLFDVHPNAAWSETHGSCGECGFAVSIATLRAGLANVPTPKITDALRERMNGGVAEAH